MYRRPVATSLIALVAGLFVVSSAVGTYAQHGTPSTAGQHDGHTVGNGTPATESPYAGGYDPMSAIRALSAEEIAQIERGEGAGFALPAELNGVPGPRHVLDLAADLGLSPEQRVQVRAVYDVMRAAAILAGQRYLAAARALEEDFRSGTLTEANLPARVAEVSRLEGALATVHLTTHLQTAAILTPDQITAYNRLRGYQ